MGVLAGCLLSLFLAALPAFFEIIFFCAFLLSLAGRQFFVAGIFALLCCWQWQLQSYLQAQQFMLNRDTITTSSSEDTEPLSTLLVQIERWRQLDLESAVVTATIKEGKAKGYKLNIRWQQAPQLAIGQHWRLPLTLRPIRENHNPGSRPQTLQALIEGVIAEGYVKPEHPTFLLKAPPALRQALIDDLSLWVANLQTAPLLLALTVGERQFSSELWLGVLHSGLGHILTISGLHIGLVFGWGFFLSGLILKSRFFPRIGVSQRTAGQLFCALLIALSYAWLAGFAIPTLRAAVALCIVICSRLLIRPLNGRCAWQFLVALLLLLNPFWVLSVSFWLSVLAVAVIIFIVWWLGPLPSTLPAKVGYFLMFNSVLTLIMSLVGLAFFNGISLLAIVSNLLFVTWCSVIAIPVLLFTFCWSLLGFPYAPWLWQITDGLFLPLWYWLTWCASLTVWWTLPKLGATAALLVAGLVLVIVVFRLRGLVPACLIATLSLVIFNIDKTNARLLVLDIGQSTALIGMQPQLNWLYLDAEIEQIEGIIQHRILPQLRYQGIRQLNFVLIPELDREMQPALQLLQQHFAEVRFYSATPVLPNSYACHYVAEAYAHAGFQYWPLATADTCLISINLAEWRLLLPGRLTYKQERQFSLSYPELNSDIYLLADYGRATANSLAWLKQLSPVVVLLAANEQGAHRYPLRAVQQRLMLLGYPLYHSGQQGALTLNFYEERISIQAEKQRQRPRWLEKHAE